MEPEPPYVSITDGVAMTIRHGDETEDVWMATPVCAEVLDLARWVRLLDSDDNVRKVERLLAEQTHDEVNLGCVIDVIEDDLGGQPNLISRSYADKKESQPLWSVRKPP